MEQDVDIRACGAHGDGQAVDTAAIQQAIDACFEAGGGRVLCGPGDYLIGSLVLRSHVELHLAAGCRLVATAQVEAYDDFVAPGFAAAQAPEGNTKSLIRAVDAQNIAITGPGRIDGSGLAFYDTAGFPASSFEGIFFSKPPTPRPRMVMLYRCRDIRIEETSFVDSPCWTFWLMKCEGVRVHGIQVFGDQRMINNDGLNLDSCREVTVSDCSFRTGDDCLVLRSMRSMFDDPWPCERVTVTNCLLDSWCQGIRIGCPSDGVIRQATFSNLVIRSRQHGITLDYPRRYLVGDGSGSAEVHDLLFSNVTIECGQLPIRVTVEEGIGLRRLSGLSFSGFRIRSGGPCTISGSPETTIRDVSFSDVRIQTSGEDAILCRRCAEVRMQNVQLSNRDEAG